MHISPDRMKFAYFKNMKRILFLFFYSFVLTTVCMAQGMSDQQVAQFIAAEAKAGTSQAQIVTKLMQRGVKIDQIRRLRNQYDSQISSSGKTAAADGAIKMTADRMKGNSDQSSGQELSTGEIGTTGEVYADAAEEVQEVEHDVQSLKCNKKDPNER